MPRNVVPFTHFARGEWGTADHWDIGWTLFRGTFYYAGFWSGRNVQRSIGSVLGPRCGLSEVPLTGVPNGKLTGFVWTDSPGRDLLFSIGTAVYDANSSAAGGAATAYTGAFAVTPTIPVAWYVDANGIVWATVYGDKTYKVDQNARTVTAVTGSPGGRCITVYGQRLLVANVSGANNRVFFSGDDSNPPASEVNFTIWDPLNYFDVGDGWPVNALLPQRSNLVIAKQKSWHLLSGVLGSTDVLRPLNILGPWVQGPQCVSTAGDNTVWFVDFNRDTPNDFNGSVMGEIPYLPFNDGTYVYTDLPPTFAVARGYRNHDVLFAAVTTPGSAMKAAFLQDGTWSFHTFTLPQGFMGAWVGFRDGHSAGYRFSDGGAIGAPPRFYGWVTNRDHPPISGRPFESIGDGTSTPLNPGFTLPEWWARLGNQVNIRGVMVDFVRWNDGFSANNHFDAKVQVLNRFGSLDAGVGTAGTVYTESFDEPPGNAGASVGDSSEGRLVLGFANETGNGWQVSFANLKGVQIRKVEVVYDEANIEGL